MMCPLFSVGQNKEQFNPLCTSVVQRKNKTLVCSLGARIVKLLREKIVFSQAERPLRLRGSGPAIQPECSVSRAREPTVRFLPYYLTFFFSCTPLLPRISLTYCYVLR